MKRKLLIGLVIMIGATGFVNAQSKIGVKGGLNVAKMTYNNNGDVNNSNALSTFNAGIVTALPLGSMFSIRPGLEIQSKGWKYETTVAGINYKQISNPIYLELPVNFTLDIPLGGMTKLYAGAGPYAAVGIAGKNKWEATSSMGGTNGSAKIEWGNDDPITGNNGNQGQFKRFDAGLNVVAGLDFGRFAVHTQYGIGLVNTAPGTTTSVDNRKNQHRVFGVSGIIYF